jgi:hypothetical protein
MMQKLMITLGASLVLALTMSAADAKKPDRTNDATPSSWTGTSPPGFAQGNKSWKNSTPPGWTKKQGKRRGWNDQSTPPGLYKRQ